MKNVLVNLLNNIRLVKEGDESKDGRYPRSAFTLTPLLHTVNKNEQLAKIKNK